MRMCMCMCAVYVFVFMRACVCSHDPGRKEAEVPEEGNVLVLDPDAADDARRRRRFTLVNMDKDPGRPTPEVEDDWLREDGYDADYDVERCVK